MKHLVPTVILAIFLTITAIAPSRAAEPAVAPPKEPAHSAAPAQLPQLPPAVGDNQVLIPALRGVVFVARSEDVLKSATATGIRTTGVPLLDANAFRTRIAPYLGKPVSFRTLKELERLTILFYREQDRPLVDVSLPEQDIVGGTVQLLVREGTLGEVRVEGNRWFDGRRIREAVRLQPGAPVRVRPLLEDVEYLERNPFRQVTPVLAPGQTPGSTDLVLKVADRLPVRVFAGYEDSGTTSLGRERFLAGINWGNGFGLEHELGYQFMADTAVNRYKAHSAYWRIPLPWRHQIALSGSYAETKGNVNQDFSSLGTSWQISGRYVAPLPQLGRYRQEFQAGFDLKSSDNDLLFGGTNVHSTSADVTQLVFRYSGGLPDTLGVTGLAVELFWGPGRITDGQSSARYQAQRAGADPQYAYATLHLERNWLLPSGFSLLNRLSGQVASGNLLPSEMFGIGGAASVRGYDEHWANGDQAFLASIELRTPAWSLGRCAKMPRFENRLQLLAFIDYGYSELYDPQPQERSNQELTSIGLGFRYQLGPHLDARFDYAWRLETVGTAHWGEGRPHVSIVASF